MTDSPAAAPIWLYDGVCVLCSGGVRYTLKHERDHAMRFVAIQSREGRALAQGHGIDPDDPESFLFIENGKALRKSEGVLALVRHLTGPARLILLGRFLPRPVRDWLYDRVARNRYRLFGRKTSCEMPDPAQRHRFQPAGGVVTMHRVLLIGGTGVFGRRLARHLARIEGLDILVTSRSEAKAREIAAGITPVAGTTLSGIGLDHRRDLDRRLAELSPWLVIDASGPFQGAGYDVPRAALEAGAHVVDLADARDYILGYGAALDTLARERDLVALAGASSTPALSAAAVEALTQGWRRIDTIDVAITPGGRSEVGRAVIEAILSYAGRPIPIWREGELQDTHGWLDSRRIPMRGLGQRRVAAVETVDAQWLGPKLAVRSRVAFRAGLESPIEQWGIMALAQLRRRGMLGRLDGLIPALLAARRVTRLPTSDRGGMSVAVTGLDDRGRLRRAVWSLLAARGDGPQVPTLPAAAALRALMAGRIAPGARPAAGVLTLDEIEAELKPYAIATQRDEDEHGPALVEDMLGPAAFAALPAPLRAFHEAGGAPVWRGRAMVATGRSPVTRLLRRIIGLPDAAEDVPVTVSVDRFDADGVRAESWARNFGGIRFASRLHARDGALHERFGPVRFRLGLAVRDGGLDLPVVAARCLGIPLPGFLLPISEAREAVDEHGRFSFDVRLSLPFFGLLAHYRGWLVTAQATTAPESVSLEHGQEPLVPGQA